MHNHQKSKESATFSPDQKQFDESSYTSEGLKKSTRNWDMDLAMRLANAESMPLLSRTSASDEHKGYSFKDPAFQRMVWDQISKKVREITDINNPKEWETVVGLNRKLREGVFASGWSEGDLDFAVSVFERSIICSLRARDYNELMKSLNGLVNDLYAAHKEYVNSYYTTLHILFTACYMRQLRPAIDRMTTLKQDAEGRFAKNVTNSMIHKNGPQFFRLYRETPYESYRIIMAHYTDVMRNYVIRVLRTSYMSVPMDLALEWLDIDEDEQVIVSFNGVFQPSCIEKVDQRIIHFQRRNKKRSTV